MIDFRVKSSGVILDIAPDATFQIEMENPMFADDRCPIPFSTEIAFLPTQKNKEQFGYLAAMFLTPAVRELDVEIYAGGVKIMDGMLRFSSLKSGIVNYTFSGTSLEDNWSGKIFEKEIYHVSGDPSEQSADITAVMRGLVDGVFAPLLVNASETDKVTYYQEPSGYMPYSDCSYEVKYHNYPLKPTRITPPYVHVYRVLTPAIGVLKILETELQNVDIQDDLIAELLEAVAILGQYKTDFEGTESGVPAAGIDLARTLPDITALELFRIILKMFCCALFRDGDRFSMRNAGDIITDAGTALDWENKVSGDAELSTVPAGGYKFTFGNDTDEDFNPNETISSTDNFIDMFDGLDPDDEFYQPFRHSFNGSTVCARKTPSHGGGSSSGSSSSGSGGTGGGGGGAYLNFWPSMLLCDLLSANMNTYDFQPRETDGETFDNSVPAKLARSIPDKLGGFNTDTVQLWRMAAIINPESLGDKRGTDVIIGRVDGRQYQQQFGDGSIFFEDDLEYFNGSAARLRTDSLYSNYHEAFAEWCRTAHQTVNADLNLTMADIASFRMWRKVAFAGRTWIVRKLTLTFYAGKGQIDSSGEFVSVL